jgi:hypothetical protein
VDSEVEWCSNEPVRAYEVRLWKNIRRSWETIF